MLNTEPIICTFLSAKPINYLLKRLVILRKTDTLDLRRYSHYREVRKDLYLSPIEVGQTITLNRVFFKRAKAELLADSYPELDRLVLLMRSIPRLKIEIRGHTDNIGDAEELQELSERRAELVKKTI